MKIKRTESYALKYKDVTFRYIVHQEPSEKVYKIKSPTLIIVYSGELLVKEDIYEVCAKSGELIFIKDATTVLIKEQCIGDKAFCGIYWDFGKVFLKDFSRLFEKRRRSDICQYHRNGLVKLNSTVYLRSLYISFIPYIKMKIKLPVDLLNIKSQEAVHCLLSAGNNKEFN